MNKCAFRLSFRPFFRSQISQTVVVGKYKSWLNVATVYEFLTGFDFNISRRLGFDWGPNFRRTRHQTADKNMRRWKSLGHEFPNPSQNVRQAPFEREHVGDTERWQSVFGKMSPRSGYFNAKRILKLLEDQHHILLISLPCLWGSRNRTPFSQWLNAELRFLDVPWGTPLPPPGAG